MIQFISLLQLLLQVKEPNWQKRFVIVFQFHYLSTGVNDCKHGVCNNLI